MFGPEYKPCGVVMGCNRTHTTNNEGREFFAKVTLKNNIKKVNWTTNFK